MERNKRNKAVVKDVTVKRPELVVVNGVVTTKELAKEHMESLRK